MRTLFTLLLFTFSLNAFCQDTIVTTGKRTHIGKIYEIDSLKKEVRIKTDLGHSVFVPFDAVKSISTNSNDSFKNTNPDKKQVDNNLGSKSELLTNEQKLEILKQEILNMQTNLNEYYLTRKESRLLGYASTGVAVASSLIIAYGTSESNESITYVGGGVAVFGLILGVSSYIKSIKAEKYLKNASISPNGLKFKF